MQNPGRLSLHGLDTGSMFLIRNSRRCLFVFTISLAAVLFRHLAQNNSRPLGIGESGLLFADYLKASSVIHDGQTETRSRRS